MKKFKVFIPLFVLLATVCFLFILKQQTLVEAQSPIAINTIEDLDNVRNDLEADYVLMNDLDFEDPDSWDDYGANYDTIMNLLPAGTFIEDEIVGIGEDIVFTVNRAPIDSSEPVTVNFGWLSRDSYEHGVTGGWEVVDYTTGAISFFDIDGNLVSPAVLYDEYGAYRVEISYYLEEESYEGFSPLGGTFSGTFDGQDYTINNLFILMPGEWCVGLFCNLDGGSIQNLNLSNVYVYAGVEVGALVGWMDTGLISNVSVEGTIVGDDSFIGGLVGGFYNEGIIENSHSSGTVTGIQADGWAYIGGLVGDIRSGAVISDCSSSANIISGGDYAGGLVGISSDGSTIENSYATGSVSCPFVCGGLVGGNVGSTIENSHSSGLVEGANHIGGLVGFSNGDSLILNSYFTGDVYGIIIPYLAEFEEQYYVGGLVGRNSWSLNESPEIRNSYSTGTVTVVAHEDVGGLVGLNQAGIIVNSYSTGDIITSEETQSSNIGGFIGSNLSITPWEADPVPSEVINSYSIGEVHAVGHDNVGGFIGLNDIDSVVENSFWDMESSGMTESDGGEGRTTEEMKDIATFLGAGWDIVTTEVDVNNGYPYLSWQVPGNSPTWYIFEGSEEEENGLENGEEEENGVEEEIEEGEEAEEDGDESTVSGDLAKTGMRVYLVYLGVLKLSFLMFLLTKHYRKKNLSRL